MFQYLFSPFIPFIKLSFGKKKYPFNLKGGMHMKMADSTLRPPVCHLKPAW